MANKSVNVFGVTGPSSEDRNETDGTGTQYGPEPLDRDRRIERDREYARATPHSGDASNRARETVTNGGPLREEGEQDQIILEEAPPVEGADQEDHTPGVLDLIGLMLGGMRGGAPSPTKPLRGNEKTAFSVIDKVLTIANGVVMGRIGEEATIMPWERALIADGATEYLKEGQAAKLVKYIGPTSLAVGVGLWAWRIYELSQQNKERKAQVPGSSILSMLNRRPAQTPQEVEPQYSEPENEIADWLRNVQQ